MKTGIKHITAFAISTLLAFSQCEKAETGSTEAGETGSGATTTLPLNIPDTIRRNTAERDGSALHPFIVTDIAQGALGLYLYNHNKSISHCWVDGYIVGYVAGMTYEYTLFGAGDVESNIVLAANPHEEDIERTMPCQLSKQTAYSQVRNDLNLLHNPQMLGRHVMICGQLTDYMNTIGLKQTTNYILYDED